MVDSGRIIARGTADELKAQVGGERVEVVVHDPRQLADAAVVVRRCCIGEASVEEHSRRITAPSTGGASRLVAIIRELDEAGIVLDDVGLRRPTLDDVFLTLTGHVAEDAAIREADEAGELTANGEASISPAGRP